MNRMILLALLVGSVVANTQVEIPGLGTVVGSTTTSRSGRTIYQFLGIPFAHTTAGEGRFQPPKPLESLNGTFDATELGQRCPEVNLPTGNSAEVHGFPYFNYDPAEATKISTRATADPEDCLNLNVYTPKLGSGTNLPVLVFYHGGAFIFGSSHEYKPDYLLDKDIILVVPQYRLGPLGFMSFELDEMAGNYGLLDQATALQWVNKNIQYFGGDPGQVTISGQSAGGASVSLMKYSPLTKGLFHKVIALSGSALAPWAVDKDPLANSPRLGSYSGCYQADIAGKIKCLKGKPVNSFSNGFMLSAAYGMKQGQLGLSGALPTVQQLGPTIYLNEVPNDVLESGGEYTSVPTLTGVVQHEGLFIARLINSLYLPGKKTDEYFIEHGFLDVLLKLFDANDDYHVIVHALQQKYFIREELGNLTAMWPGIIDFCGNMFIKGPVYKEAKYNSEKSETYLYSFNYHGSRSKLSVAPELDFPLTGGVDHAGELKFLFPAKVGINAAEEVVSKKMVDLWTSFVINGKPSANGVPDWPLYSVTDDVYMKISDNGFSIEHDFSNEYSLSVKEFREDNRSQ